MVMKGQKATPDASGSARFIELGKTVKPHGLKGAIKTIIWSGSDENLRPGVALRVVCENGDESELVVARVAPVGGLFQVYFEGVNTVEAAERFRNATLLIPRDALPEGLYLEDLRNLPVRIDSGGAAIGKVAGFYINPAGQCYGVIGSERYVALFLPEVRVESGEIVVPERAIIEPEPDDKPE